MAEDEEVIAEFMTETEARSAQIRLAEEGILSQLRGVESQTVLHLEEIQLAVPLSQAGQARRILRSVHEQQLEPGWEDAAEEAINGWVCEGCDTIVALEVAFCPECGSTRSHVDPRDDDYEDDED